jgi:hypothetical protein
MKRGKHLIIQRSNANISNTPQEASIHVYYLQQFQNDNISKAAAFYCKYHMFSYNICFNIVHNANNTCMGYTYSCFYSVSQQLKTDLSRLRFEVSSTQSIIHTGGKTSLNE